jgi:DNA-binding NtrC family response regulator
VLNNDHNENHSVTKDIPTPVVNANVLVIEDDPDSADLYVVALARAGFGVRKANDRQEAMKILGSNLYQVIVMDVIMPGPSLDLFMSYRNSLFAMSKLILISASSDVEQEAKKHRIHRWLRKPFDTVALWEVVSKAIQDRV